MKIKFGTDGFRGYIGKDFTFETATIVAKMALSYFNNKKNTVAIGYDTRFLSKEVAEEISQVASDFGYTAYLADTFVPSPALSLITYLKRLSFGIMITASHNPPQFNGVKIKENFGGSALYETVKRISKVRIKPVQLNGLIENCFIKKYYFDYLKKIFPISQIGSINIKVLVNPMFGAAQGYMTELFNETNISITEINNIINPSFGGINPEPTENNLLHTREQLLKEKYQIAFAFDGDGDRIAAFDHKGAFYSTQKLLPLFMYYLIKKGEKGAVIKTVSTTSLLSIMAKKHNLPLKETPIGFKNIVPYFLSGEALIGGEESGGMAIKGYIPERDGIYMALMILKMLSEERKSLSEIYTEIEDIYGKLFFRRDDYSFSDEDNVRIILNQLDFDKIAGLKVMEKNFMDGRKFIISERSFLLVRVSGTEPVVRVYAESESEEKLQDIFYFIRKVLQEKGVNINHI